MVQSAPFALKIQLRSYQTECIESIWNYFRSNNGNPVCALPTGTGKSVCIAGFIQSVLTQYNNQRIMVLTHVKELIEQNYNKLVGMWPTAPAGVYSAGLKRRDTLNKVIFAGIGSVAKKPELFGHVDLVIVDECHLVSPNDMTMYRKFFDSLMRTNPYLKVIGFTATPWRLGHGKITEGDDSIFTDICFDITGIHAFNRLIAEGFLAPLVPKVTRTILDVDGVHMRGGEFIAKDLQEAVDQEVITRAALQEALEYQDTRKKWLIFASGVEHAIHIDEILQEYGLKGAAVHSKMTGDERDEAIRKFQNGEYQYLVNNNILTTGFDCPEVDLIIVLRPTASSVLWVQMLGRGTRPFPGKVNCLVLDFARNTKRLGPINDPVVPRKKGEKGGPAPIKECPKCGCDVHASLRWCNSEVIPGIKCDYEFKFETKLQINAGTDEIIKGDLPVVEVFGVDYINYTEHHKLGKPPSMKVSYICGKRIFNEFVCLEHPGNVANKAQKWVRDRLPVAIHKTADLLAVATQLKTATHVKVWTNQKYPSILGHCFDGTAFGTLQEPTAAPKGEVTSQYGHIKLVLPHSNTQPVVEDEEYGF